MCIKATQISWLRNKQTQYFSNKFIDINMMKVYYVITKMNSKVEQKADSIATGCFSSPCFPNVKIPLHQTKMICIVAI